MVVRGVKRADDRRIISGIAILSTGDEAHDCPIAQRIISRVKSLKRMLGDNAYDRAVPRDQLHKRGANCSNRNSPFRFSKLLHRLRGRIEGEFSRLKDFRRIANIPPADPIEGISITQLMTSNGAAGKET
jgi:hypothetical protein